jgi:predicted nucleic acid-binding protein
MSDASFFVDTNILVYAHHLSTGPKHDRAKQLVLDLWTSSSGVISTQVLQEFCFTVRRLARNFPIAELREMIRRFAQWRVVTNTSDSVLNALTLESRYNISFWDALIVNAAQVAEADVLYTEDLNHGQIFGSVRVVNPFHPE